MAPATMKGCLNITFIILFWITESCGSRKHILKTRGGIISQDFLETLNSLNDSAGLFIQSKMHSMLSNEDDQEFYASRLRKTIECHRRVSDIMKHGLNCPHVEKKFEYFTNLLQFQLNLRIGDDKFIPFVDNNVPVYFEK